MLAVSPVVGRETINELQNRRALMWMKCAQYRKGATLPATLLRALGPVGLTQSFELARISHTGRFDGSRRMGWLMGWLSR